MLKQLQSGSPADVQLFTPWGQAAVHVDGHNEGAALLVDLSVHLHRGAGGHMLNGFLQLDVICLELYWRRTRCPWCVLKQYVWAATLPGLPLAAAWHVMAL